jgi:hypothetical protein
MEEEVQKSAAGVAASFEVQQLQASLEKTRDVRVCPCFPISPLSDEPRVYGM